MFFAALATGLILFIIGCLVYRAATRHRFETREIIPRRGEEYHDYYGSQHRSSRPRESEAQPSALSPDYTGPSLTDAYHDLVKREQAWVGGGGESGGGGAGASWTDSSSAPTDSSSSSSSCDSSPSSDSNSSSSSCSGD